MLTKSLFFFCVSFGFLFPSLADAAHYTVCASGCDYTTIQAAMNEATSAGDAVIIEDSRIYAEGPATQAAGSEGSPITVTVGSGDTPTITGEFMINHDCWTLNGLTFDKVGANATAIQIGDYSDYINIQSCNFDSSANSGDACIAISQPKADCDDPKYTTISNCTFKFTDSNGAPNPFVFFSGTGHIVENCEFTGYTDQDAFRVFGYDHIIRDNYIHDVMPNDPGSDHMDVMQTLSTDHPTKCRTLQNLTFERNKIINWGGNDTGSAPWMLNNGAHDCGSNTILIRNNIFTNYGNAADGSLDGIKVHNNVFYYCGGHNGTCLGLHEQGAGGDCTNCELRNNIFLDIQGNYAYSSDTLIYANPDYNLVYPIWGPFSETHGINGQDPLLTDPANGDFTISSYSSPAVDNGNTLSGFSEDILQVSRPIGDAWDIGAYEYNAGPNPPANLRITN